MTYFYQVKVILLGTWNFLRLSLYSIIAGGGGGGQLPTARPSKHKKPDKMKQKVPTPSRPESELKPSLGGSSMPNLFTDLGDDLQLTDESDD